MSFGRCQFLLLTVCFATTTMSAACPTCASFDSGVMSGAISFGALTEASGIAASARNPGVLWTHNDGSAGRIWALSTNGARLATYDVNNVDDLEDIAVGPGPTPALSYLYIGDIGGNVGTNVVRPDVKIIRIPEPAVDLAWASAPRSPNFNGRDNFTLVYPDGTRGTRDMTTQRQFDMAAAHIIKVRDRKIHEIEATGAVLPFNSKNGWSDFLR